MQILADRWQYNSGTSDPGPQLSVQYPLLAVDHKYPVLTNINYHLPMTVNIPEI